MRELPVPRETQERVRAAMRAADRRTFLPPSVRQLADIDHGTDARIRQATEGILGLPDEGPWDRILVSADFGRMPDALVAQLAEGGRMVAPIAGAMQVVDVQDGRPRVRTHGIGYALVPLRD